MIRDSTGLIHTIAACWALFSGLFIFARPKATRFHKMMGYTYCLSIATLIVTAFSLYHLTGSFSLLHLAAILSCPPLLLGLNAAVWRKPKEAWLIHHYYWMCWSFVGLFAALMAEITTRIIIPYVFHRYGLNSPGLFWSVVGVASGVTAVPGWYFVERNRRLITIFQSKVGGLNT